MYITKTEINLSSPSILARVADRQESHLGVVKALPPLGDRNVTRKRTLWRLLPVRNGGLSLIVVSPDEPDMQKLESAFGGPGVTKPYIPSSHLDVGKRFRFDLEANPASHVRIDGTGKRPRRTPSGPGAKLRWLRNNGGQHGFDLDDSDIEWQTDVVPLQRKSGKSSIVVVRYRGALTVTDPEALSETMVTGFGRARAFGCGLLLLSARSS